MADGADLVFELRTVQGACIKSLVEVLKEILTDINIIVQAPDAASGFTGGIKLMAMDTSNCALIHLFLEGDKFEVFTCERNLVLGVSMMCLFKLVKSIGNNDVLTMFVSRANTNILGINISNTEKKSNTTFNLKLLDIDDDRITVPDVAIEQMVYMPSVDFQRLMRDMSGIGSTVLIEIKDRIMRLTCEGDFASQITQISTELDDSGAVSGSCTCPCPDPAEQDDQAIDGRYSLKFLNAFAKSTSLCPVVELYMRRKYPLVLLYRVANLGKLRFALAPQVN